MLRSLLAILFLLKIDFIRKLQWQYRLNEGKEIELGNEKIISANHASSVLLEPYQNIIDLPYMKFWRFWMNLQKLFFFIDVAIISLNLDQYTLRPMELLGL